jgi:hypothetical protein
MRTFRALPIGCAALASLVCSCRKELGRGYREVTRRPHGAGTNGHVDLDRPARRHGERHDQDAGRQPRRATGDRSDRLRNAERPPAIVPAHYDPTTGVLTAAGPMLDADITPVSYTLTVGGTPWVGSIDFRRGVRKISSATRNSGEESTASRMPRTFLNTRYVMLIA